MSGRSAPVGYSGTPLPKKLGFTDATRLLVLDGPPDYDALVGPVPPGLVRDSRLSKATTVVHLFVLQRRALATRLATLRKSMHPESAVWVSWPKKSSRVPTDVTEDVIRDVALPLGFVDIKVCAVSDLWSGLKLVVRKELRAKARVA